jgi:hypothetical protein
MQQKTIDVLRALWAQQTVIPSSIWDDVLWLDSRHNYLDRNNFNAFGITRSGLVQWEQDKEPRKDSLPEFMRTFPGTLDEREARRRGREILLLTIPPEKIRMHDLITCRNAEVRKLVYSRAGNQIFLHDQGTNVVDQDVHSWLIKVNPRRVRRLFSLLEVQDATSGERYLLRVPDTMRTCREAVAWTFGFRPEDYQPLKET